MLIILSPAKKQNFEQPLNNQQTSVPFFLSETEELIEILRQYSQDDIKQLMGVSDKIAELNFHRYKAFQRLPTQIITRPAIFAFKGDVYKFLELEKYNKAQLDYMQSHFRILSGLYGILLPLDLIQAHRLEMGTKLLNNRGDNLYQFWSDKVTDRLNSELRKHNYLINLASNEYFTVINKQNIDVPIINIMFKEYRDNMLKTIALNSKRARSMMSNFIIKHQLQTPQDLQEFNENGYQFNKQLSSDSEYLFIKENLL